MKTIAFLLLTMAAVGADLPRPQAAFAKLPLSFEVNQGQTDRRVQFLSRGPGYTFFLSQTGAAMKLGDKSMLRMKLAGANSKAPVEGMDRLPGNSNYFIGSDPSQWHTEVPNYAKVRVREVYAGIDLIYYGNQRELEYDWVVKPGADPAQIRFEVQGAEVRLDSTGDLLLKTAAGEVRQRKPVVYQGDRKIDGGFVLHGHRVSFEVARYDRSRMLVIDPVLVYSTYLGGTGQDQGTGIAVDASGNAYVSGWTSSTNFPTANALQAANGGGMFDAFVTKISADGSTKLYSTYLGGSGLDQALGIAVDASGNAYVTGVTGSTNFPTTAPLQAAYGGGASDAFVTKLNSTGSAKVYSTYLGGSGDDTGRQIAVDASGNAYVVGYTTSTNFPTANPLQATYGGGLTDVFVAKISADGSTKLYSTYLGGSGEDGGYGIAVDASGNAYVTGLTASTNFPTTNPLQATYGGGTYDAFVTKISANGSAKLYSTYLGGADWDQGEGIAVDSSGNAYVIGLTHSTNFPTANAMQTAKAGGYDAFVAKISADGSTKLYSTYLGGTGDDYGYGIAVDGSGNAYVTGYAGSSNFPTANPLQAAQGGFYDAFVAKFSADGSTKLYSTYLGGSGAEYGISIAVSGNGSAYVTGATNSTNFPTANAMQPTETGVQNAFVSVISGTGQGTLSVNRKVLNYGISGSLITSPQTVLVTIANGAGVAWTATSNQSNITVSPASGIGTGTFQVSATLGASGTVTVTAAGAANSPQTIQVNVASVTPAPPFGSFDTPITGTTGVIGAIPVTGWALDNIEVTHVDIFREPNANETPGVLVFIGTAVFSADARPDVAAQSPNLPFQYRAGWGYQMLTNFLPNSSGTGGTGNGTYKLHAIAFDKAGKQTDLGATTITVDNAHATKPFGTLDTPSQGGTVSGADYVNFGWALTPQPGIIPMDGSTMTVVIDGVVVGHPVYNNFRSDIASLFPNYANSQGAIGFFHLNTLTLANGVHTISWNVFDNLGRGEGLGSRYFNVLNTGTVAVAAPEGVIEQSVAAEGVIDQSVPAEGVRVRHGLQANRRPDPVTPDGDGGYSLTMEEVGLIELHLGASSGNMLVDGEEQALPVGSTLKGGVFYWQPGPGFLGEYTMRFTRGDGTKIPVRVNIVPKRFN
jgi:hypothetical protein